MATGSGLLNLVLALLLSAYAWKRRSAASLAWAFFIYGSLHYAYAILPIFLGTYNPVVVMSQWHSSPPKGPTLAGAAFVLFILILLLQRYGKFILKSVLNRKLRPVVILFSIWLLAVGFTWLRGLSGGGGYPSAVSIKGCVSTMMMLFIAFGLAAALTSERDLPIFRHGLSQFRQSILTLTVVMVVVALFELLTEQAWASFRLSDQTIVLRASALLFNPNVLGVWFAFIAMMGSFSFHAKRGWDKYSAALLIGGSLGIFLSGSRSSLLLAMAMLSITGILLLYCRVGFRAAGTPFLIFFTGMVGLAAAVKVLEQVVQRSHAAIGLLARLADRFIEMPLAVASHLGVMGAEFRMQKTIIAASTMEAIEGRFSSNLADNAYLAMIEDAGWVAGATLVALWLTLIWLGLRAFKIRPNVEGAYALSLLLGSMMVGMFMRAYQVFPVWGLISLSFAIFGAWLMSIEIRNDKLNDSR